VTQELTVTIWHYGSWDAIKLNHLRKSIKSSWPYFKIDQYSQGWSPYSF